MIKVFLVEDEIVMREGIKKKIPWETEGYEFAGEASDGELAYPLIKKVRPDIIITDIKMPFMDGLELSKLVKKEMPKTKIIVLSGYNDFEYAQKAIRLGVAAYLLKPITPGALLKTVSEVAEQIRREREEEEMMETYKRELEENTERERKKLFDDIVKNRINWEEAQERGRSLGIELSASRYQVMLLKLLQEGSAKEYSEEDVTCQLNVQKMLEQEEHIISFIRGVEGWGIILLAESRKELDTMREQVEKKLQRIVGEYEHINWFGDCGSIVESLEGLSGSYHDAEKAFAGRFFAERNRILSNQELDRTLAVSHADMKVRAVNPSKISQSAVGDFLKNGTRDEVDNFVKGYMESVGSQNLQSLLFRQYIVMNCYFTVRNYLQELKVDIEELSDGQPDVSRIAKSHNSIEYISSYLKGLFAEAIDIRERQSDSQYEDFLKMAKEYIHENYANDKLSLNMVAKQVNVSPNYFSRIFSWETGCTFTEYLTKIRMEKAKERLMCTNHKTTEIAYEVGYKDSHYFSYLFKKTVGCTPREYRMRDRMR